MHKFNHLRLFDTGNPWRDRFQAAFAHFFVSLLVAGLAAALVFLLWFPHPYRDISGGRDLFLLLITVDVVLGPVLTAVVFSRKKPVTTLLRDLALIAILQLSALGYGLWTVGMSRPVFLTFEFDRYRVVHAIEVDPTELLNAPPAMQSLPLFGPQLLALRDFKDSTEKMELTFAALGGSHLSAISRLWQPYELAKPAVIKAAKPLSQLRNKAGLSTDLLNDSIAQSGVPESRLLWLPLASRSVYWTVLLDAQTAQPVGFLNFDSF